MNFQSHFSDDYTQNALVKWTSDSYILRYYHIIGGYFIEAGDLVCDAVYLNLFDNFKQWYTTYGGGVNEGKTIFRLNTVILTKLKIQSINGVSNNFRGDSIMLGTVYVCDSTYNEILETIFQGKNYIMMNLFWKEKLRVVMTRVHVMKNIFLYDISVSAL